MNNEIESLYPIKKKNNKIPFLIIVILIIGIATGLILKTTFSNENSKTPSSQTEKTLTNNNNVEEKKTHQCTKGIQNIDFATVEELYEFEYEKNVINNERQIYIFKFINKDLYSKIGMNELFTQGTPSSEFKDDENITKTYYFNRRIPSDSINDDQVDINKYLEEIQARGYTCN